MSGVIPGQRNIRENPRKMAKRNEIILYILLIIDEGIRVEGGKKWEGNRTIISSISVYKGFFNNGRRFLCISFKRGSNRGPGCTDV